MPRLDLSFSSRQVELNYDVQLFQLNLFALEIKKPVLAYARERVTCPPV
jgi:hypothetical protein